MVLPELFQRIYKKKPYATIASNSMFPKLKVGQKIEIKPNVKPKIGDVIVWQDNDKIIAHRFYLRIGDYFLTKGDNNKVFDKPWHRRYYIGKVKIDVKRIEKMVMILDLFKALPRSAVRFLKTGRILKYRR